jgi:hypothetical protein
MSAKSAPRPASHPHAAVKRMDVQGFVSKNDWLGKPDHKKEGPWLME